VSGTAVDPKSFSVNQELSLIRWSLPPRPKQASAHIQVAKALSTEELTVRWRKLAIILPVAGSLATAVVTSLLTTAQKPSATQGNKEISRTFERSNDFLATGDKNQFPSILRQTKREAWFVGTTFYISIDQYHDLILKKLSEGVDLNFLVLNPEGDSVKKVAHLLGVAEQELSADCLSGIRILSRTNEEARRANYPGTLRTRLIDEALQTRLYIFDPKAEGRVYFVPQLNGTNSQTLPGFLVENSNVAYHSAYFNGVLKMWNDPAVKTLEEWKATHPDL
jgi:hypothetical protein